MEKRVGKDNFETRVQIIMDLMALAQSEYEGEGVTVETSEAYDFFERVYPESFAEASKRRRIGEIEDRLEVLIEGRSDNITLITEETKLKNELARLKKGLAA